MAHVFISYKHEDLAFAQELALFAQSQRVPIWLDTHIQPGEEWREAIDKAITEAFAVVAVMTPEARLSEYITYEWAFAMGLRIPVIPVLLRPTPLHPKLEVFQYLDFTRGASMQPWLKLIKRLQAVQKAPPPHPAPQPTAQGGPSPQTKPPTMEEEMRQSIVNFLIISFSYDPAYVFGTAKSLVRRFEDEPHVLEAIERKIQEDEEKGEIVKNTDLGKALALISVLNLSPATPDRNRLFLQMGMPAIPKKPDGK